MLSGASKRCYFSAAYTINMSGFDFRPSHDADGRGNLFWLGNAPVDRNAQHALMLAVPLAGGAPDQAADVAQLVVEELIVPALNSGMTASADMGVAK